jgi:serine/threonine-protein kinase
MRRLFTALALVATLGGAPRARAQSNKVAAEALFEEGRRLMAEGKVAEACPKFADSHSLDPTPGTLLNLASCYEKMGMTATAWATYREAASLAAASARADLVAVGQRHAEALAPKLSRLSIVVPSPSDGMQLRRDGVNVTPAERGVAIPVDPGRHRVEVTAPKKKAWTGTVDVVEASANVSLTVPPLEDAPPEPPSVVVPRSGPAPAPAEPAQGWGTQKTIGAAVAGAGVVALGVSAVFAVTARSRYNDSLAFCPQDKNVCFDEGVQKRDDARTAGNVATVAFVLGVAAVGTGAGLFFFAPKDRGVQVVPTAFGALVRARW